MRILHTSDWHLGRNFHGVQLLDDQATILGSIVDLVRSEGIDVVVIAGDIYDRAVPSADAVRLFGETLGALRAEGAYVVAISGNHDSAARIGFAESVLAAGGVTLRGDVQLAGRPVILPDEHAGGLVAFYPIPYLDLETARHALNAVEARSHERLLRVALERARADLAPRSGVRSVAIAHAFVAGGQESESELALSVGGSPEVSLSSFSGFDYVALGHLHGRQSFFDGKVRYSGSPLPYSFSERSHVKGGWLVDLPKEGDARVSAVDFPVLRRLSTVRGELSHLLSDESLEGHCSDYVQATLTDPVLPMGAMASLRRRFPHALHLVHEPPRRIVSAASYSERIAGRSDFELSVDFVSHVTDRDATAAEKRDLAQAISATTPACDHHEAVA